MNPTNIKRELTNELFTNEFTQTYRRLESDNPDFDFLKWGVKTVYDLLNIEKGDDLKDQLVVECLMRLSKIKELLEYFEYEDEDDEYYTNLIWKAVDSYDDPTDALVITLQKVLLGDLAQEQKSPLIHE